jgi:hypothetical protein
MTPKEFNEWIDCGYSLLLLISATGLVLGINALIFIGLRSLWFGSKKLF